MPTGVLIPYAPPGADRVLEAAVEKGGQFLRRRSNSAKYMIQSGQVNACRVVRSPLDDHLKKEMCIIHYDEYVLY
jgi:hypothetical protein